LPDLISLAFAMLTLGQIGLCVTLLMTGSAARHAGLPLCVFFMACAIVIADPIIASFLPSKRIQALALTLPACLIVAPALWLYVEALTSEAPWKPERKHIRHFILFLLGLLVAGLVIALPNPVLETVFLEEDLEGSPYLGTLFTAAFLLVLGLIVQSGFYLIKIYRHLVGYRQRIKENFANIEHRELLWINAVLILLVLIWIFVAMALIGENVFDKTLINRRVGAFMGLVLVWTVGLWGLRQAPGFERHYVDTAAAIPEKTKYKRSALSETQAQRIAKKIKLAMENERLHLDPNLSLSKLASRIGASSNHVSQTLNETLGVSFFDYINRWRVEDAKQEILSGEQSVLNISLAVGFNTSSSFYKAFKNETGKTPRDFRNSSN
jgi:AraC-like DNA-binding protein